MAIKKEDYLGIENYKVVGTRPIRHDGTDKVTGRAVYGPDFHLNRIAIRQNTAKPSWTCADQIYRHQQSRGTVRSKSHRTGKRPRPKLRRQSLRPR